jgi:hypothetical protein
MQQRPPLPLLAPLLVAVGLLACDDPNTETATADASPYVDSCLALCLDELELHLKGLAADQTYQVSATTESDSVSCTVDTHDGVDMDCGDFLYYTSRLDDIVLTFSGTPPSVTVEVSQGGALLANKTLEATYETRWRCGNSCLGAAVTLEL